MAQQKPEAKASVSGNSDANSTTVTVKTKYGNIPLTTSKISARAERNLNDGQGEYYKDFGVTITEKHEITLLPNARIESEKTITSDTTRKAGGLDL